MQLDTNSKMDNQSIDTDQEIAALKVRADNQRILLNSLSQRLDRLTTQRARTTSQSSSDRYLQHVSMAMLTAAMVSLVWLQVSKDKMLPTVTIFAECAIAAVAKYARNGE